VKKATTYISDMTAHNNAGGKEGPKEV